MTESREVIGFVDDDGRRNQWHVDDCRVWSIKSLQSGRLFCRHGRYVWLADLDRALGRLARVLPSEIAAEMLLGHGYELPCELVRLLANQETEKPKTQTRSKPRRPRRPTKVEHGLASFADSKRQRDSRAGFPETHDTQGH